MNLTLEDVMIAARTVDAEARGEGFQGMKHVAWVMKNRWFTKEGLFERDDTLATACLRHRQFSAWNEGDANFERMQKIDVSNPAFRLALRAVLEVLDEQIDTLTIGSTHYHNAAVAPSWAAGKPPATVFGNHLFFNNID